MDKINYVLIMAVLVASTMFELDVNLAALLFIVIAGILVLSSRRNGIVFPPVSFIAIAYTLGYAGQILWPELYGSNTLSKSELAMGMNWAVRGFGVFALGYVIADQLSRRVVVEPNVGEAFLVARLAYGIYILKSIAWLALAARLLSVMMFGISLTFIESSSDMSLGGGAIQQIFTLLSSLRYPFFLGFMIIYLTDRRILSTELRFLFVVLMFISVLEIVTIGSKSSIISLVLILVLSIAFVPSRFSLNQLVAGGVSILLIYGAFGTITEYREIMYKNKLNGVDVFSISSQVNAFGKALSHVVPFTGDEEERVTEVDQSEMFSRFGSGMFSFANLLKFTSGQTPYEHAWENFLIPLYAVVPRMLISEKPEFFSSGRHAKEYYGWSYGGISVSLLGSFYYAWGYVGVVLGMAVFGYLFGYLVGEVARYGIFSPYHLILFVIMFFALMDVGKIFQALLTNLTRVLLLLLILKWIYSKIILR